MSESQVGILKVEDSAPPSGDKREMRCICNQGGKCHRVMHKEGTLCDRIVLLTKNSRHRICKGCRSVKRKVRPAEDRPIGTHLDKQVIAGDVEGDAISLLMLQKSNADSASVRENTEAMNHYSSALVLQDLGMGALGDALNKSEQNSMGDTGDQMGVKAIKLDPSTQQHNTQLLKPASSSSYPSAAAALDKKSQAYDSEPAPYYRKNPASMRQRGRPKKDGGNPNFYYAATGTKKPQTAPAKAAVDALRTMPLMTKNGHAVQLLPCVCVKGGSCHRADHAFGEPCTNFCRISKNVRHRVCKACRSGGRRGTSKSAIAKKANPALGKTDNQGQTSQSQTSQTTTNTGYASVRYDQGAVVQGPLGMLRQPELGLGSEDQLERGLLEEAETYIEKGDQKQEGLTDTDAEEDETPLCKASREGHVDKVKALLREKADANIANNLGETPLYLASCGGHVKVMKALLAAKAEVNKANNDGWTSLVMASSMGHVEVVETLLVAKADADKADNQGRTPLLSASQSGHVEVVETLLVAKADVDKTDNQGGTPLLWASQSGHVEVVKTLLAAKADVDKADNQGRTPLLWASQSGHVEVVEALLAVKAEVNKADNDGQTPLYWALLGNHHRVADVLRGAGALSRSLALPEAEAFDVQVTDGKYSPREIAQYSGIK